MDMLNSDVIVFDETFVCLGYEYYAERAGALWNYSIQSFKELRRLVQPYGNDRVVLSSDCGG